MDKLIMYFILSILLLISFSAQAAPDKFISSQSMGSTFTSNPRVVQGSNFSIQVVYTGTPNGSIKLQVSNDELNWEDLPSTTAAITTAGATLFNVSNAHYGFVRVIYTRTSSTGSLDATYLGK